MRYLSFALACSAAAVSLASGQDIDRSKRPVTPSPPTFKFPKVTAHTLPNGLRVLVSEDHALPLVAVRAVVGADSTLDPIGKEGLYALSTGVLREGTISKNPDQLAESFADIGATVAPTAYTTTTRGFAAGLALMGDMLMHPALEQAGIDRRKALQSAAARRLAQSPVAVPRHLFNALLYGAENGYVRSLAPTEASIAALTRDDVLGFYERFIQPQTTTIVVTGDVTDGAALAAVSRVFGEWKRGSDGARPGADGTLAATKPTTIYLYDNHSPQAYVYVGNAGPARDAPDYMVADVMGAIVSSRVTQTLREEHAFTYSGVTGLVARRAPLSASFLGSASITVSKVDSALVEWLMLLRGLRGERPITAPELEATRRNRIGVLPARTEGPDSVATRIAELVRDNVPLDYWDRYVQVVSTLTPRDVAAAATKYVDVDHLIIVVSGDRKVLEPALRAANVAPVVIVDANGRPID
jgi:zinc protease